MTETSSMAANRASCEKLQQQSLQKCQRVAYLAYAMDQMGCKMSHLRFDIRHCQSKSLGGFEIDENGQPINHIQTQEAMDRTLAHEMIHAFDHCRAKVDWENPAHIACTEIRAAALSGDCDFKEEVLRQQFNIVGQHPICTRRRAKLSMSMHPSFQGKESDTVDQVFETCYRDTAPYREIP
ncbi:unnamed protein product [Albugo candida]|uniref:Mitochondrial inner membrane protease ATP23 n=1 Tax=Albugo candida TaxID=65357 RepID=A0A024GQ28_9STRA|nr:unnamed protein product [Albugo candida]|eukprot:CCI48978.1 unnamed protein product [Albugo candida]